MHRVQHRDSRKVKNQPKMFQKKGRIARNWLCWNTIIWFTWQIIQNSSHNDAHWSQETACESCSVMPDSLRPHGLYSPWNSPGQSTGVGSLSLLQAIFPIQGLNPGLLHYRQILYQLSYEGSPTMHKQNENFKIKKIILKYQTEIMVLKNIITGLNNSLKEFNIWINQAEEWIKEVENGVLQWRKKLKKKKS